MTITKSELTKLPTDIRAEVEAQAGTSQQDTARLIDESRREIDKRFKVYAAGVWRMVHEFGVDMRRDMPRLLYMLVIRVAEGRLDHRLHNLWLLNEPLGEAMIEAEAPLSQQIDIIEKGTVPVYDPELDDVEQIPVEDVTAAQVEQVVDVKGHRTRVGDDQRRYVREQFSRQRRTRLREAQASGKFECNRRKKIVAYQTRHGMIDIPFADLETMYELMHGRIKAG